MTARPRYSSKTQEQFFRPERIKVIWKRRRYHKEHRVVRFNVLTWQIIDTWTYDHMGYHTRGKWESERPADDDRSLANIPTKAEAVAVAKKQAISLSLAFSLTTDIVPWAEITEGPIKTCLTCEERSQRSHTPFLCIQCKHDLAMGQDRRSARRPWLVALDDLIAYRIPGRKDAEAALRQCLLALSQSSGREVASDYGATSDESMIIHAAGGRIHLESRRSTYHPRRRYAMWLTDAQAAAMQEIIDMVSELCFLCYDAGHKAGCNLLARLAKGGITLDTFEKARETQATPR